MTKSYQINHPHKIVDKKDKTFPYPLANYLNPSHSEFDYKDLPYPFYPS